MLPPSSNVALKNSVSKRADYFLAVLLTLVSRIQIRKWGQDVQNRDQRLRDTARERARKSYAVDV